MVKLAEKERDGLEGVKNEAEAYMLKELSHLKWREKASKLAHEDTTKRITELQDEVSTLEANKKTEREKIRETSKELKELEAVHEKNMKRKEELDNDLRRSKEKFKDFERQDIKYREDLKHIKQKIKKLDDKLEKDSTKIDGLRKECEESTSLIPKLEESIPQFQKLLTDEEKILDEIQESSKVETERYRSELAIVRVELEPWEKQLTEHRGKLNVACTESKLLSQKHEGGRAALDDARKQMVNILKNIEEKSTKLEQIKTELQKRKLETLKAQEEEQECIKEQGSLIPVEHAARQKVAELKSVMDSEKSQGSVLKAILKAKKTNEIEGIYGRMGDLGAIDEKELHLVDAVKKSEEENSSLDKEIDRLVNLLKQTEEEACKMREEEAQLKDSLKEVEAEVIYLQEALGEAKSESMKLKESLLDKENEFQSIHQENEELFSLIIASLKKF
uniref:Uncharacterized protein n=1 Tax=Cucumis sativus TaxID=3659 RepID=A0A0A0KUL0_CUCSA